MKTWMVVALTVVVVVLILAWNGRTAVKAFALGQQAGASNQPAA